MRENGFLMIFSGRLSADKKKKETFFRQATGYCNKAGTIGSHEVTVVTTGMALLFEGKDEQAAEKFRQALTANPDNVPAILGNACLSYKRGDHNKALKLFQQVLQMNPGCPPSVRIGMALCYHKLKKNDLAKLVRLH